MISCLKGEKATRKKVRFEEVKALLGSATTESRA